MVCRLPPAGAPAQEELTWVHSQRADGLSVLWLRGSQAGQADRLADRHTLPAGAFFVVAQMACSWGNKPHFWFLHFGEENTAFVGLLLKPDDQLTDA